MTMDKKISEIRGKDVLCELKTIGTCLLMAKILIRPGINTLCVSLLTYQGLFQLNLLNKGP